MKFSGEVDIKMKSGDVWTFQMTDTLVSQIKEAFLLSSDEQITERHVKYFLVNAIQNGMESQDVS